MNRPGNLIFLCILLFVSCKDRTNNDISASNTSFFNSQPITFIYESDTLTQILDFLYLQNGFEESDTIWHNEILSARKDYIHIAGIYRLVQIRPETEIDTIFGKVICGGISDCLGPEIEGHPLLGYLCGFNDLENKVHCSIEFLLDEDVFYSARLTIMNDNHIVSTYPNLEMMRLK